MEMWLVVFLRSHRKACYLYMIFISVACVNLFLSVGNLAYMPHSEER